METQEKFMFSEPMQFGRCSSISKEKGKTMGKIKDRLSCAWEIFLAVVTLTFAIPGIILEERRAAKARALDAGYDSVEEYEKEVM